MAIIDLRNASVFIMDGTVGAASTTLATDASKDVTTITVASTVGFSLGSGITIGSGIQLYEIVNIAGSVLTITPPLPFPVTTGDAVVEVGNALEAKLGEGTLTYSEKRGVTYVLNRGRIYTVKLGDDAPVEVSLQFIWEFLRGSAAEPPTIEEALKQIGRAANWVSSSADPCEPYAVTIAICNVPPCSGESELIKLTDFRWTDLDHDLKAGQVSVKGSSNIAFAQVTHVGG